MLPANRHESNFIEKAVLWNNKLDKKGSNAMMEVEQG